MKIDALKKYISMGREIEFSYQREQYSITYSFENDVQTISFCRFGQLCTDFGTIDDFISCAMINDEYLRDILALIEDVVIY